MKIDWLRLDGFLAGRDVLASQISFLLGAIPASLLLAFPRGLYSGKDLVAAGGLILLFSGLPLIVIGLVIGIIGPGNPRATGSFLAVTTLLLGLFSAFMYSLICLELGSGGKPCREGWVDWLSALIGGEASLGLLWGMIAIGKDLKSWWSRHFI